MSGHSNKQTKLNIVSQNGNCDKKLLQIDVTFFSVRPAAKKTNKPAPAWLATALRQEG